MSIMSFFFSPAKKKKNTILENWIHFFPIVYFSFSQWKLNSVTRTKGWRCTCYCLSVGTAGRTYSVTCTTKVSTVASCKFQLKGKETLPAQRPAVTTESCVLWYEEAEAKHSHVPFWGRVIFCLFLFLFLWLLSSRSYFFFPQGALNYS